MPQTIILRNQTPNPIDLDDIAITVPGSGQITASERLTPEEIRRSDDLLTQVNAGTVVVDDGTNELDTAGSQAFMGGGEIAPAVDGSLAAQIIQQTVVNEGPTILAQADAIVSTQPDLIVTSGTNEVQLSLLAPPDTSSAVQARRTTSLNDLPLTWTDLTLDATDVETNSAVIEHDNTNTDRILIKAGGLYQISYAGDVDDEGQVRVRVNDATVLPGSTRIYGNPSDAVALQGPLLNVFFANLSAGDFLTPQVQAITTSENLSADFIFCVARYDGAEGPQGPQGPPGSTDKKMFHGYTTSSTPLTATFTPIPLDVQVVASGFTHTASSSQVTFDEDMLADISYYITTDLTATTTRTESEARLEVDTGGGFVVVPGTLGGMYNRNFFQKRGQAAVRVIRQFSTGDIVRLVARGVSGATTSLAVQSDEAGITIIDAEGAGAQGATGPVGPQGPQGVQGQPGNPEPTLIGNFPVTVVSGSSTITLNSVGIGGVETIASDGDSSTSSTTPVNKVTLTTSSLPAGTYRIGWYYEWSHSATDSDFRARVFLDGTTTLMEQSQEPQDAGTDQRIPVGGHVYTTLGAGVHTVALDFWAEADTATIRRARLELWRIA